MEPRSWDPLPPPIPGPEARRPARGGRALVVVGLLVVVSMVGVLVLRAVGPLPAQRTPTPLTPGRAAGVDLRITGAAPSTWDPALQSDAATAGTLAQVFEGLTVFDADSHVQPALARSWVIDDAGRRIVFTLRDGLQFSDGRPIAAADVVASWLRLLDPARPSPLSSLLTDIRGAPEYLHGSGPKSGVGLSADGNTVVVEFSRPASYFLGATASPSLAVVPPDMGDGYRSQALPATFVASGGYVPTSETDTLLTLRANPHYWAGEPPLKTIEVVTDLGGESATEHFSSGDLDYTALSASSASALDWSWVQYDPTLGPQLRRHTEFSVQYYGFDTRQKPFDDARVRRAFAQAVDWRHLVQVSIASGQVPATSLVPIGIPAAGSGDYTTAFDPAAAAASLADAGFAGGKDFPEVTLRSDGGYDDAIARELKANLGITIHVEILGGVEYFQRLVDDPPQFWSLSWIADYPAPQDFLGLLLETGSSNNYGHWSNADFDAALAAAAVTADPAEQASRYDAAQRIVQREVPVIPVAYGQDWALSRTGLLGGAESGVGLIRYAGLSWATK